MGSNCIHGEGVVGVLEVTGDRGQGTANSGQQTADSKTFGRRSVLAVCCGLSTVRRYVNEDTE